ncbi:MAG TPA: hypothetical protein VLS45_08300 [Methylomicrobium sp.]|nr:hypothetical protein [Methylomicrobium sp.]
MATVEDVCAKWILQYEAYRVWQQFQRDGKADYSVRRWSMQTVQQVCP